MGVLLFRKVLLFANLGSLKSENYNLYKCCKNTTTALNYVYVHSYKRSQKSGCKFAIMKLEITGIFLQFWHVKIRNLDRMNTCLWWHMFKSNIEKILSCLLVFLHFTYVVDKRSMYLHIYILSMHFNIDCKVKTSYFFHHTVVWLKYEIQSMWKMQ